MEQIFLVENSDLDEVNRALRRGGRVKMIQAVSEAVTWDGITRQGYDEQFVCDAAQSIGNIFAYVVIEFD